MLTPIWDVKHHYYSTFIQTLHDHHCYAKEVLSSKPIHNGFKIFLKKYIFTHIFFFWICLPFSWFITTNLLFCFMKNFAKRVILLKMFSIHCTIPFRVQSWIVTGVPCQETCSFHLNMEVGGLFCKVCTMQVHTYYVKSTLFQNVCNVLLI